VRVRVWGCRGSLASPGAQTARYGGNTSCVEVRAADGTLVVLDAGTGIRELGAALASERPKTVHLLLTHLHLDHVEGLGFFTPRFDPEATVHLWSPPPPQGSLSDWIASYLSPPLFPVPFDRVSGRVVFHELEPGTLELGSVRVLAERVTHPGPTFAYRLEEDGRSLAFVPDHEPALTDGLRERRPEAIPGSAVALGADLLFHDAQYTAEEYATRIGWGHSALPDFAAFVRLAAPGRVLMFHHDPAHTDEELEEMLAEARTLLDSSVQGVELAFDGMELELGS
jgi:phosphoribosyl 1,2-cyclic phosphodiesterase